MAPLAKKSISFTNGTVCLQEVGLQVHVEKVTSDTLESVIDGQNVDALAIWDIFAGIHGDQVT